MFFLPLWFILSVLNGFASNSFNFLNRLILRHGDDPISYAWMLQFIRLIVFSILAIFDWHLVLTPYSITILALLGITELISINIYMKMHAYTHLSISAILSRTRLIWVPILGFIIIGETLKFSDYFGILIIFLGVSTVMAPKKLFVDKGAFYANLSAFMIALNIVFMEMALPFGSNSVLNVVLAFPSVVLFPFFMKDARKRIKASFQHNLPLKLSAIGFNLASMLLFVMALRLAEASKVNAVYQGMMIFSVLAGIIFLKETDNIWRKLIGATITIVGVVLLSFS